MSKYESYHDFFKLFNIEEYLNSEALWLVNPEVKKKYDELKKYKGLGFEVKKFTLLGNELKNKAKVSIFYTNEQYAYHISNWGDVYARIYSVLVKKMYVEDSRGREIYKDVNGTFFVAERTVGSPSSFGTLKFEEPAFPAIVVPEK